MTTSDWINLGLLIVSSLALLVAIGTAIWTVFANRRSGRDAADALRIARDANQHSEQANRLAQQANILAAGDSETAMMAAVNQAWDGVNAVRRELDELLQGRTRTQLSAADRRRIEGIDNGLKLAIERVCDTYETACGRYIDGKCDKDRFKKLFHDPIRQLVQNDTDAFKQVLKPGPASKYKAILKVHEEWHNLEK